MPAMELLCQILGVKPETLSREENIILEAELFSRLFDELKKIFKTKLKNYFRIIKLDLDMEETMIEQNFIRCVINDIISTENYTLEGIAYYTQTPEEIIYEIAAGENTNPSLLLSRRIIEIHRNVRPDLYREIFKKITKENSH